MKYAQTFKLKTIFVLVFCFIHIAFTQSNGSEEVTYIKAGKMFDSKNGEMLENQIIKIEKNKISEVSEDIAIPDTAKIIDLTSYTVLPGLIDGHTHLMTLASLDKDQEWSRKVFFDGDGVRILRGAKRAKSFLETGFTTIRDLGDSGSFLDVALKRSINEGSTIGPRMFVSGPIISSVGGQVRGFLKPYHEILDGEYSIVRSIDDAINVVREHVTFGADIIKICANNSPNNTTLTIDEMKAIVKMAHRYNLKVTAHAKTDLAIWEATSAGVDGIEHGNNVSDKTLKLMAKKGVVLVPTVISQDLVKRYYEIIDFKGDREKGLANFQKESRDRLQRAIKFGVTIVTGSDNFYNFEIPQGDAAKNILSAYFEGGMKPLNILQSSTYLSAKFMGKEKNLGIIAKDAFADIVAVQGDVENDFIKTMLNVVFVMKDGKVYVEKTNN